LYMQSIKETGDQKSDVSEVNFLLTVLASMC
jgi:hypothetical protein